MLRCQFLCYILKTLFSIKIALKLSYSVFLQKNAKFSSAGGFALRPPEAGDFASRSWGLRPQTPIGLQPLGALPPDPKISIPTANFWLRA